MELMKFRVFWIKAIYQSEEAKTGSYILFICFLRCFEGMVHLVLHGSANFLGSFRCIIIFCFSPIVYRQCILRKLSKLVAEKYNFI